MTMRYIDGFEIYSAAGGETTQKDVLCRWQNGYAVMVPGRNGNGFSGTLGKTIAVRKSLPTLSRWHGVVWSLWQPRFHVEFIRW
jgi:hypothetical protein